MPLDVIGHPLLYQQAGCCAYKGVVETSWKNYNLTQPRNSLPQGAIVVLVHMASVWVPFTSEAKEAVASGGAAAVAFARSYIGNPDLVERFKSGVALAQMNPATIYGGGAEGYTDYPAAIVSADA